MAYTRSRGRYGRSYSRGARARAGRGTYSRRRVTKRRNYSARSRPQEVRIVFQTTPASAVASNPFAPVIEAKKAGKAKL